VSRLIRSPETSGRGRTRVWGLAVRRRVARQSMTTPKNAAPRRDPRLMGSASPVPQSQAFHSEPVERTSRICRVSLPAPAKRNRHPEGIEAAEASRMPEQSGGRVTCCCMKTSMGWPRGGPAKDRETSRNGRVLTRMNRLITGPIQGVLAGRQRGLHLIPKPRAEVRFLPGAPPETARQRPVGLQNQRHDHAAARWYS
jgi:hypothetical protein